jgi:hypothetical protein
VIPTLPIHPWFEAETEVYSVPEIKNRDKPWLVTDMERKLVAQVPGQKRWCSGCLLGIPSAIYPKLLGVEFSVSNGTMSVTFDPNYKAEIRAAIEDADIGATPVVTQAEARAGLVKVIDMVARIETPEAASEQPEAVV